MGSYGRVAVMAARLCRKGGALSPPDAWRRAVGRMFPDSELMRAKVGPRRAFLGLCSDGWVAGVPPGAYTRASAGRTYAVRAAAVLEAEPGLAGNRSALWRRVTDGGSAPENGHMDVVISLWEMALIATPAT